MKPNFVRPHIQDLEPYEPIIPMDVLADQLQIPIENLIKLDANENPYGMPPLAHQRLSQISFGHIYPDPESRKLREKLSKFLELPMANIAVGAGADELIDLTTKLCMDPGDKIINCPPTFGFYAAVAQVSNLERVIIPRRADLSLDLKKITQAACDGAKMIFLANPNNPDGGLIPPETIQALLALPLLVVLDEAYVEFAPENTSWIKVVPERENLIVLRTFSKWGGLAGIRLGYGAFPAGLLAELMKIKQPYNIPVTASEAGMSALDSVDLLNQRRDQILIERSRFLKALQSLDWLQPYPTQSNFVLCKVIGRDAKQVKKWLEKRGVLIRYFNKPRLRDHVRFSIGKPEEMQKLMNELKEINL
jgi:histidinol-phosphate aminotransferase